MTRDFSWMQVLRRPYGSANLDQTQRIRQNKRARGLSQTQTAETFDQEWGSASIYDCIAGGPQKAGTRNDIDEDDGTFLQSSAVKNKRLRYRG